MSAATPHLFSAIELVAFILPALPKQLWLRLTILSIYFIGHAIGLNKVYKAFKADATATAGAGA